MINTLARADV